MAEKIFPLGDSSLLVHFGDDIDLALNLRVHALDARLQGSPSRPDGMLFPDQPRTANLIECGVDVINRSRSTPWTGTRLG